jgi:RHS repeat-associated protein
MAGISSKAAGVTENKKNKFQNQEFASKEFSDGSGLDMYEFKWRMHDPQIGRFWQIDPLASDYVYNSTYAFSENKVTGHIELEGLESVEATSSRRVIRGLFNDNVQKRMTATTKNASEAAEIKVTVGPGIGVKGQALGVKGDIGANGPQASITTNLGGKTKGEGSVASAGGQLQVGPLKLKAGTSVGNVEFKDGQVKVDPLKSSAGLDISSSKDIKQDQSSAKAEGNVTSGTLGFGAQLGLVGIEATMNVISGGKAVVNFFGSIVEYVKAVASDATQDFGGGKKNVPQQYK